jgi:cytochrome oxidase Cu insertion factor (SCO1/SenC/PrrC family)
MNCKVAVAIHSSTQSTPIMNTPAQLFPARIQRGRAMRLGLLALTWLMAGTPFPAQAAAVKGSGDRPEMAFGRTEEHDYDPPEPGSYTLPILDEAADGPVLDSEGRGHQLRQVMGGRVTVLSFVYLRCRSAGACPHATGVLRQIHELSGEDPVLAQKLRLITMSFDPSFDTPERMASYAQWFELDGPAADWCFLTTHSEAELDPILEAYNQPVDRRRDSADPAGPYYHPVRVYLIDAAGRIRNIYSLGLMDPRMILTDVRTLLLEQQSAGGEPDV